MSQKYLTVLFIGFITGSALVLGINSIFTGDTDNQTSVSISDEPEEIRFATSGTLHANVYHWGITKEKNISSPARIYQPDKIVWTRESFINDRASMADLWWFYMSKTVSERPDVKIIPYQVNIPDEFMGVYVSNDSRIKEPEDLEGKTIAVSHKIPQISAAAEIVLNKEYGLNVSVIEDGAPNPQTRMKVLRKDNVDAVVMVGTKRAEENNISMRPVFYPFKEMEEKFGDAALPTFFVVENDSQTINTGFEMMEVLQKSSQVARAESDEFMDVYEICNEFMVQDGREQIERMSPEAEEQLQYFIDAAYEQGYIERNINISERLAYKNS